MGNFLSFSDTFQSERKWDFFFFFFLQNTSAKYSICDQKKQDNRERAMEGNEVKTRSFQIRWFMAVSNVVKALKQT